MCSSKPADRKSPSDWNRFRLGLNPERDAIYLNVTPSKNDGTVIYKLTVKDVLFDRFWSISVYDAKGHYVKNEFDAYTLNNITARK